MNKPSIALPRMARVLSITALVSLFSGALVGCGPSINAAAKADIDRRVTDMKAPANTVPAPAPSAFLPLPLAAGQWSQFKMVNDKSEPSFMTYKVLSEEGGAYWIEIVMDTYHGKTIEKMLANFGDRMDPSQVEIRAVSTKDAKGRVNTLPPEVMPMMQSLYKGAVSSMVISWKGLPQEAAVSPAGKFGGCYKVHSKVQYGPWKSEADSWSHPAVPINGLVRSVGTDKKFEMELVAYGLSGATSEF